jgi:hypothetical protein
VANVKTPAFMLSSATIMLAPAFATDVFALTPDAHSVGMCREVSVNVDSSMIELKNGIAQALVEARRTNVSAMISGTVFEYTAKNLLVASALDTSSAVIVKRGVLTAAANAAAVALTYNSDPIPGQTDSAITAVGDAPSGSTVLIQRAGDETAYVFPTVSTGATTGTGPWTTPIASGNAIPAGMSFPIGSRVWILTPIPVASTTADALFGVKITGTLSNYDRPVTAVFPKCRINKGFNLSYAEQDFGSMPWEFSPVLLAASEATGRLAEIGTNAPGRLFIGA